MRLSLFAACAVLMLSACQTGPSTSPPSSSTTSPAASTIGQALGIAYTTFIAGQTAYLTYLNTGIPSPATVGKIAPLYAAAQAALTSYSNQVAAGTVAPGSSLTTNVVAALTAFTAALSAAGIQTGA